MTAKKANQTNNSGSPDTKKGTSVKTETAQHPLAHLIPDADWHETYISRTVAGVLDLDILLAAKRNKHNVLFSGPTGSAKTSICQAFASLHQLPLVNVPCHGAAEPSHFVGRWNRLPNGQFDFFLGALALAVQYGGVILLDEVNFLKPSIGAYLHGLLDGRRILEIPEAVGSSVPTHIKAHDDCFIVGAYNPNYHGTRPLNEAFKNRFAFQIDFPYSEEVELQLVESDVLRGLAGRLRQEVELGNLTTPISTNLLIEFEEIALDENLGFDFALTNLLNRFPADERFAVQEVLVQEAPRIHEDLFGEAYPSDGLYNPAL